MYTVRPDVLSLVQNREILGCSPNFRTFRGLRPVRLRDLKCLSRGSNGLKEDERAVYENVVFHRLSHDSTKLVGVRNYSHTLLENNAPVQIIVYDTLPCYIIERIRFPLCRMSMNDILFTGFNRNSSIFCAICVWASKCQSNDGGFISNDSIRLQFGLFKYDLCLLMNIQSSFESEENIGQFAKSMLKSSDNLFVLSYGRSDISIFGFYDILPNSLMHSKIFKIKCDGEETSTRRGITFTNGGLDVTDVIVTDGRRKKGFYLLPIKPQTAKDWSGCLYFTHTHIDLERIFKYATEQTLKKMNPGLNMISVCKCQATVLEIVNNDLMHVHLSGMVQVLSGRLNQFVASSFLVCWDLNTNALHYRVIGAKQRSSPSWRRSLDGYPQGRVEFYDIMTSHESVFNGESITSMGSYYGDIELFL